MADNVLTTTQPVGQVTQITRVDGGTLDVEVMAGTAVGPGASDCVKNLTQTIGLYACAENSQTSATGYASHAEGDLTRAGLAAQAFTVAAGGTLVTIAGDVTGQFENTQPVRITPTTPGALPTVTGLIASQPVFAAGNTTFNLAAAIDLVTTGGTIVMNGNTIPVFNVATLAAGGVTLTFVGGDVTGRFALGSTVRIYPIIPDQIGWFPRTIVTPPVFAAGNTTFNINAKVDNTTTAADVWNATGYGLGSHAEGTGTVAIEQGAHAEGVNSISSGVGSHAEGLAGGAYGRGAHAEGWYDPNFFGVGPQAYGPGCHAEGEATVSAGFDSHAEGISCSAWGFGAHAEGIANVASGDGSHSEGSTNASGNQPVPYTIVPGGVLVTIAGNHTAEFVNGDRITLTRETPVKQESMLQRVNSVPAFAAGNTTFNLLAALDGTTTGGQCVDFNFGVHAHSEGSNNTALGAQSHVEGANNTVTGAQSHVEGQFNAAAGAQAHAEGQNTSASAQWAHSEGTFAVASGNAAHAEGSHTLASGAASHAEGLTTQATAASAHAEGEQTIAAGNRAHAEGFQTLSNANSSHAEGFITRALGGASHAEGIQTNARELASHAEGMDSLARLETSNAQAGGFFAANGDNQTLSFQARGSTPGAALGETTLLKPSSPQVDIILPSSTAFWVRVRACATRMGLAGAARQTVGFDQEFMVSVDAAGTLTFSAVATLATAVQGAGFVGATLVPSQGAANLLIFTFAIAGGLTVASRCSAKVEWVEVLGT